MSDWQIGGGAQQFSMVGQDILARLEAVYPSLTANTKGSWVELTSSSEIDASAITVMISYAYGGADYLVDVGIGALGSEQVLISNLSVSIGTASYGDKRSFNIRVPIAIPAGTRISARVQATGTSTSRMIRCGVLLEHNGQSTGGHVITLGATTADSGGIGVDPGGTDSTKGAWSEISASTTSDIRGAFFCFGNKVNTSRTSCDWLVDIGIGAAASEQVILPNISLATHTYPDSLFPCHTPLYNLNIPAGSRVTARSACTIIDATDRLFDIAMYGIT